MQDCMHAYIVFDLENDMPGLKFICNTSTKQSANMETSWWWNMHDIFLGVEP